MSGVVIHIGFDKTGTTSLQMYLRQQVEPLAREGLIYPLPASPKYPFFLLNHEVLTSLVLPIERLPPATISRYGSYRRAWLAAEQWIRAVRKLDLGVTDTIILSSEAFYSLPGSGVAKLREIARQISNTVNLEDGARVIGYVSEPAGRYRRAASQSIVSGRKISRPSDQAVKSYVEKYFRHFGKNHVQVRAYDRETLVSGNVVDDFMHFLRPQLVKRGGLKKSSIDENRSPSSEALLLCSILRELGLHDSGAWKTLVAEVILFDRVVAVTQKASLSGAVHDYLAASSPDYDWLREECGCVFKGSGRRIPSPGYAGDRPLSFPDIFRVDMDRYRELVSYFLKRSVVFGETQARGADLAGKDLISAPCTLD